MPTETRNETPSTGANATQERGAEGTAARAGANPNNQQAGTPRTRTAKAKAKTDVKKFRGETVKMNGHVFQLHAERTNLSQFEDTMEAYGRLDILFNNAGVAFPSKIENLSEETWDLELAVHAKGAFLGTKTAIPAMRRGGGGSIINTSSIMGIVGSPTTPAYSAAKGAIRLFTKTAALQYAAENIRVNSIHPGYATTPLTAKRFSDPAVNEVLLDRTPMGRLGTAEDIANGVLFLASDESAWMTGTELVIDGGMTAQ